jgi:cell division septation protein DedD
VRAVFLVLLSANLLFLAWARWIDSPRDAGARDASARLPRLQLVTESRPGAKPTSAIVNLASPSRATSATSQLAISTLSMAEKTSFRTTDPAQTCTSVGPFNDIASAARAAGVLTQRGFHLQQRAEEGDTIEGYWVFVGGMESDEDVAQIVGRLEKSGFTDAHIMKNYSTNRRVSVGMFSTRERAEKRASAVRNLGLQPEIGERKFPGTVYWVDVTLKRGPGSKQLPPEYSFADIGHAKVGMQPCPAGLRPIEPGTPLHAPGDDGDGAAWKLPRTTVASAPKVP